MEDKEVVHSDQAIPPGEFLVEVMEDLRMSREELARRIEWPVAELDKLFRGGLALDNTIAVRLEAEVGVPAHIWRRLEREYRLVLSKEGKLRN